MLGDVVPHDSVLIAGEAGIGKTTFVKKLALDWSGGKVPELNKFDFLFVIPLRDVQDNRSVEDIIVAHHIGLSANGVEPGRIAQLMDRENG